MRTDKRIILTLSGITLLILSLIIPISNAVVFPSGIVAALPINFINQQANAIAANTVLPVGINTYSTINSIMGTNIIGFNAIAYQPYETCNLNNGEFFLANGQVLNSWLEGNTINEQTANTACTSASSPNALAASANILYWVEIPTNTFLPANTGVATTNTLYLGWAGNTITASNTLLSNTVVGEAPQLSCNNPTNTVTGCTAGQYGQYDNGNVIFGNAGLGFYDNFSGTTLRATWGTNAIGNAITNNGLSLSANVKFKNYLFQNSYTNNLPITADSDIIFASGFTGGANGGFTFNGLNWNGELAEWTNPTGFMVWSTPIMGSHSATSSTPTGVIGSSYIMSLYTSKGLQLGNINYDFLMQSTNSITGGNFAVEGFENEQANAIFYMQWLRAKTAPPNGIYPGVSFSPPIFPPVVMNLPANIIVQNVSANPAITFTGSAIAGVQACTGNFLGGTCIGNDVISGTQSLTNNLYVWGAVKQNSGTLTLNGFTIISNVSFNGIGGTINSGLCIPGGAGGQGNINGPTGGQGACGGYIQAPSIAMGNANVVGGTGTLTGGASGAGPATGGYGGNTIAAGGAPGNGVNAASGSNSVGTLTVSNSNILKFLQGGINNYLAGAGGGGGGPGGGSIPGSQGNNAITSYAGSGGGGIGCGSTAGASGGGGSGIMILAYSSSYTAGTYNTLGQGSVSSCAITGNGGSGAVIPYQYSTPPIPVPLFTEPYPLRIYNGTGAGANEIYTLNSIYNGITTTLASGVANLNVMPPATQPYGFYTYNIIEFNTGTSTTNTLTFNLSINMTDIITAFTYNNPIIQYFPNFANCPTFISNSLTWYIKSDAGSSYGKKNQSNPCGDIWSNANKTFTTNIILTFNGFSTFQANIINNPAMTNSITQTSFAFQATNGVAAGTTQRKILNINSFNEKNFNSLIANTSVLQIDSFNNYTIQNQSAFNSNTFSVYISNTLFQNPTLNFITLTTSSTAASHVLAVNNYCPSGITSSQVRTLNPYLVDNGNGTLATFNIFSGFGQPVINNYLQIMDGISNITAIGVQQFRITQTPFQLPLIQGGSYAFRILDVHCNVIYSTNYSIWTSPITLQLPTTKSVPTLNYSNPNVTCKIAWSAITHYSTATCNGNDPTNLVNEWNISLYNSSSLISYARITSNNIFGSAFTWSYSPLSNSSVYSVKVIAIDPPIPFFFTLNSFSVSGYNVPTYGFITLIFVLIGLGGGKVSAGEGSLVHQISNTCFLEALILFFCWAIGLMSFFGNFSTVITGTLIFFLVGMGIISYRYEGNGQGIIVG